MSTNGINAGRLRQLFTVEQQVESKGAMGGTQKVWTVFADDVRGSIVHNAARDMMAAGQTRAVITARALIRYHAGITAKMRLNDNGTIYSIEGPPIDRSGRRRVMELHLSEGKNDG